MGEWEEGDDLGAADDSTEVVVADADAGPSRSGPRRARPRKKAKMTQVSSQTSLPWHPPMALDLQVAGAQNPTAAPTI